MRVWLLALVAALAFAGCGNGETSGFDFSTGDQGAIDLGGGDQSMLLIGCMDLILCDNMCKTQACLTKCESMATAQAKMLHTILFDCISGLCATAPDGGMGPCALGDRNGCNTCVMNTQSGRSPSGQVNGACSTSSDPVCGLCVDPLITCANDLTM
ncbi:MAG TPA: hypothetical protein VFF06_31015 [Polyangia bacterium]|nr:hypothetical protein [Polyangia bacterium]